MIRFVYVKIPEVQNHKIPEVAPPGIRSRDCPPLFPPSCELPFIIPDQDGSFASFISDELRKLAS